MEDLIQTVEWLKEAGIRCKRDYAGLRIRYELTPEGVMIRAQSTLGDKRIAEVSRQVSWLILQKSQDDPLVFMELKLLEDLRQHLLNLEKSNGS